MGQPIHSTLAAGALDPQGPAAAAIADLWWVMFALGAAVFAVVVGLLAAALVRRPPPTGDAPSETGGPRGWIVGGGVIMPSIVLVVVLVATVSAMRFIPDRAPDDALVVEIVGHQWWWEVHYPEQGVTTRNELHLPVGRPTALHLTSADVIHSFWVPALGGKMDLLPDGTNTLVLQADEAGEHLSQCAEFCGLEHATMRLTVVAEPEEQLDAWLALQEDGGQ